MAIPLLQPSQAFATSQSDRAYYAIRAMIVRAELAPGALINESELVSSLGLGRTPVRVVSVRARSGNAYQSCRYALAVPMPILGRH